MHTFGDLELFNFILQFTLTFIFCALSFDEILYFVNKKKDALMKKKDSITEENMILHEKILDAMDSVNNLENITKSLRSQIQNINSDNRKFISGLSNRLHEETIEFNQKVMDEVQKEVNIISQENKEVIPLILSKIGIHYDN